MKKCNFQQTNSFMVCFLFQMERELASLRRELEGTRNTLKMQTARCRQIVAAFTRKLEEKDCQVRQSEALREQQLNQVVRALLIFEAQLRREQRNIRSLLGERDAVIRSQQMEIAQLKESLKPDSQQSTAVVDKCVAVKGSPTPASTTQKPLHYECDVKPDLISSLGITQRRFQENSSGSPSLENDDSVSNMDSLQLSLYECSSQPESLVSNVSTQSCDGDVLESFEPKRVNEDYAKSNCEENKKCFGSEPMGFSWKVGAPNQTLVNVANKSSENNSFKNNNTTNNNNSSNHNHNSNNNNPNNNNNNNDSIVFENYRDDVKRNQDCHNLVRKGFLTPVKEEVSVNSSLSEDSSCSWVNDNDDEEEIELKDKHSEQFSDIKRLPSTLLQEVRIGTSKNEYKDNPVLNCVNQILLRDQEEFLEEQRTLRLKEQEKSKLEPYDSRFNNLRKISRSKEDLSSSSFTSNQSETIKEKNISPNKKTAQHFEEKACILLSSQGLKLAGCVEFEDKTDLLEKDKRDCTKEKTIPTVLCSSTVQQTRNTIPPALPPKPNRLLVKKHQDINKSILESIPNKFMQPKTVMEIKPIEILNKCGSSLPEPSQDSELYVISNSAIDDELLEQIQGRKIKNNGGDLNISASKTLLKTSLESLYTSDIPMAVHRSGDKTPIANSFSPNDAQHIRKNSAKSTHPKIFSSTREDDNKKVSPKKTSPMKKTLPNTIKVASPVASLLATGDTIDHEVSTNETSPSVSQIVRRFEDLGTKNNGKNRETDDDGNNALRKNFEEFRLDDCDMEALCREVERDGRLEGDGAETRLGVGSIVESRVSYDNFLEATGLSQKSIMTPSRMFSNHKSVLKPKDVKHRNRVKAAAVERCSNVAGPTVRYWTEPFL